MSIANFKGDQTGGVQYSLGTLMLADNYSGGLCLSETMLIGDNDFHGQRHKDKRGQCSWRTMSGFLVISKKTATSHHDKKIYKEEHNI